MSLASLTTLAAKRDEKPAQADITRGDLGRGTDDDKDEEAKFRDVLLSLVPTAIVAPYTFIITAIAGLVDDPTTAVPEPDDYALGRWVTLGVAVGLATYAILKGYYDKRPEGSKRSFPLAEFTGGLVATVVWGLTIPESPLIVMLEGKAKLAVPGILLAAGAAVIGVLYPNLKKATGS
jgi:hypothetical protein